MDQREKRYGKDDSLRKRNQTVQRNIDTEKKTTKKRINQDSDRNEERRCPWNVNLNPKMQSL
jgi:hypothetical protein